MKNSVCIIGAGASGLMAAITAASEGADVTVLEQNDRAGRKLCATGNGKCNITHLNISAQDYFSGETGLIAAVLEAFSVKDTIAFFEDLGLRLLNRNGWLYPATEQASQVLELLMMKASSLKIKLKTNEKVLSVHQDKDGIFLVQTKTWTYHADSVIAAAGSPASAVRGSSPDALELAESFGIRTVPFQPALVPLKIKGRIPSVWAGTRVHGRISITNGRGESASDCGELQLTDQGISGIPVFQISPCAVKWLDSSAEVQAEIDFLPDMTEQELADEITSRKKKRPSESMVQLLIGLVPDKLTVLTSDSDPEKTAHKIKHFHAFITGPASLKKAQTCLGGVDTRELTKCLEARKMPGLFFCGEAVDVTGPCGGYNLQWAWSGGHMAGYAAAHRKHVAQEV